ncbi:MAG TPA: single-stranded DNA-binding protein [Candidatus Cloacimonetes bacterium]|nr:single-stranded DNA-binding protein [Candidatus Cloacimonadota bacterium]HEX38412.1 single-stranded DNA-binding protein [Candidatus Cloacimonadota bacterium]
MAKKLNLPRINSIIVSGRLTRDVELRYTGSGTPVATMSIAVDRVYRDSDNNWQTDTSFFRVVAWARLAERSSEMLSKGSPVIIEGTLQSRTWQDKDDNNRTSIEIVANRIQNLEREVQQDSTDDEVPADEGESNDDIPF